MVISINQSLKTRYIFSSIKVFRLVFLCVCVLLFPLPRKVFFFLGSVVGIIYQLAISQNVMDRFGSFFCTGL